MNNRHLTLVGWFVFLLLMYYWSKTDTGHAFIYYGLVLVLIFLLSANGPRIVKQLTAPNN